MAINEIPSDGDGDGEEGAIVAEINITPLPDIFLVLLIIFAVTTTIAWYEGENIELPEATESEDTPPKSASVAIDAEGIIKVNDTIVPAGMLEQMIEDALEIAEQKGDILKGVKPYCSARVDILDIGQ